MKTLFIPIIVVLIDQFTKIKIKNYWIENELYNYDTIPFLGEYVRFVFVENPGIAFGIDTSHYHIYIIILTVIATLFLSIYLSKLIFSNDPEKYAIAFVLGGALGNLIDRILISIPSFNYSGVVDFIDIGYNHYRWYTFNIADASITIGLIILIYHSYFLKSNKID